MPLPALSSGIRPVLVVPVGLLLLMAAATAVGCSVAPQRGASLGADIPPPPRARSNPALYLAATMTPPATPPSVTLVPRQSAVSPGSRLEVDVVLSSEAPTRGTEVGLDFDPALARLDGVVEGTFYSAWAKAHRATTTVIPRPPRVDQARGRMVPVGIAIFGGPPTEGPTARGRLVTVNLTILPGVSGVLSLEPIGVKIVSSTGEAFPSVVSRGTSVTVAAR